MGAPGRVGTPPAAVPASSGERQLPRDAGPGCPHSPSPSRCARSPRASPAALTHAGHAGHVQLEAVEAVAGVAFPDAHAAPVLAAVEDPALLSLQPLEALVEAWKVARRCQSRVTLRSATKWT